MEVQILRTGVANIASVKAAFERLGAVVRTTDDPATVESAAAVVLPGVGSFEPGMLALQRGLGAALVRRIESGAPTLAICLGLQLLCRASDEAPGSTGLGVLPTEATRLPNAPRLPHIGWNAVRWGDASSNDPVGGDAYFAHTYCLEDSDALEAAGWSVARTTEGSTFVSAVERGAVLGCQFHPELSGRFGRALLTRWLAASTEEVASW